MSWLLSLLLLGVVAYNVHADRPHVTCERTFSKLGCFREKTTDMEMIVNDRDRSSPHYQGYMLSWKQFKESVHSLACRCAAKAKSLGYSYFAIRFWGECHAGKDEESLQKVLKDPSRRSNQCVNPRFKPCDDKDEEECVGKAAADYIYSLKDKTEENIDGGYGEWSAYSDCSATCGNGIKTRERTCTNPVPKGDGKDCSTFGEATETQSCKVKDCPIDGGFTLWSEYSTCTKSCGGGSKSRTRSCTNPAPAHGGAECSGPTLESKECNTDACPVDGGYGPWGPFGKCSAPCGPGTQEKTRQCNNPSPAHGGRNCAHLGAAATTQSCEVKKCPVNGGWDNWSTFSPCTATCGGGSRIRIRACVNPPAAHGGKDCEGEGKEEEKCGMDPCPIDGVWTEFSAFGSCSKPCGGGTQTKSRTCTNPPAQYGGKECSGPASQSRECNTHHCPVDGGYGSWGEYGPCSKSCGPGIRTSTRKCDNPPAAHGGLNCDRLGPASRSESCEVKKCPVNGGYGPWGAYGLCSKPCGPGIQTSTRECNNPSPAHEGKDCKGLGPASRTQACEIKKCPVNGGYGPWTKFSTCSAPCGPGTQYSTRACKNPPPAFGGRGCTHLGPARKTQPCEIKKCPINGRWSNWSSFSGCTVPCGGGTKVRTRACNNPRPAFGGSNCAGSAKHVERCSLNPCPVHGNWGPFGGFGACNKPCGGGYQNRVRLCNSPAPRYGGRACSGSNINTRPCNTHRCAVHGGYSPWAGWGSCSVTCGGGIKSRSRSCNRPPPAFGGKNCARLGPDKDWTRCNMHTCRPRFGPVIMSRVCEHARMNLNCGHGKIQILSAYYGRTSRNYCGYLAWWRLNCRSTISNTKMAHLCNNRNSCTVYASNSVFGDPCLGTVKYLEVQHRCKFV